MSDDEGELTIQEAIETQKRIIIHMRIPTKDAPHKGTKAGAWKPVWPAKAEFAVGGGEIAGARWQEMTWYPSLKQAISIYIGRRVQDQFFEFSVLASPFEEPIDGVLYTFWSVEWWPLRAMWTRPELRF